MESDSALRDRSGATAHGSVHINCGKQCAQDTEQQDKCLISLGNICMLNLEAGGAIHFLTHSVDKIVAKYTQMHPSH